MIMELQHQPAVLVLSRQGMPTLDRSKVGSVEGVRNGAYVVADAKNGKPDALLLATGTEVSLCMSAYEDPRRRASTLEWSAGPAGTSLIKWTRRPCSVGIATWAPKALSSEGERLVRPIH